MATISIASNGSGAGNSAIPLYGVLGGIVVKKGTGVVVNTTDMVIKRTVDGVDQTVLTLTDIAASDHYNPQNILSANAGGADVTGSYSPYVCDGEVWTATIAQSTVDLAEAFRVTFIMIA